MRISGASKYTDFPIINQGLPVKLPALKFKNLCTTKHKKVKYLKKAINHEAHEEHEGKKL